MSVIRKIKVKTGDPNFFEEKNLGALAENIKCVFPLYNEETGAILDDEETKDLLSELISYRDQFNNIKNSNNNIINSLDSLRDNIDSINNSIPQYSILYSNVMGEEYFIDEDTKIGFTNCQLKLYNKYLPICVIGNENEPYDIYYSILNEEGSKIEVFATLQLSFREVAASKVEDEFTPEENKVYSKCIPSLTNIKYFQTDLKEGSLTELEETSILPGNRLTITQIKSLIISQ